MNKIKKYFGAGVAALMLVIVSAQNSFATLIPADLTTNGFDMTDVESLVGLVITGLVVMWGARKIIKTINRS